ncbi:MAG: 50S ribosomal protein L18 [Calditrichaeota bacterium]|nr:MAG: 50S ribosomal protein L18 [Calditrichota bacterium]
MSDKNKIKLQARYKRKVRARKKINGTSEVPRLSVFRSLNNVYAQLIDDENGLTLVSVSTLSKDLKDSFTGKPVEKSFAIGEKIAELALAKEIKACVFDKSGYKYHGRVKALADGARKGGLKF